MPMNPEQIERIFYGRPNERHRFTQDFPVLPDVWIQYAQDPHARLGLLLTPHYHSTAAHLARYLRARLEDERPLLRKLGLGDGKDRPRVLLNESVVLAFLTFAELIRVALPLSYWWRDTVMPMLGRKSWDDMLERAVAGRPDREPSKPDGDKPAGDIRVLERLVWVVGGIWAARNDGAARGARRGAARKKAAVDASEATGASPAERKAFYALLKSLTPVPWEQAVLWSVNLNRRAPVAVWRSRLAVKADAASSLFNIKSDGLRWAVIDTGVDATHPAFYRLDAAGKPMACGDHVWDDKFKFQTRVVRTYDFLRLQDLLDYPNTPLPRGAKAALKRLTKKEEELLLTTLRDAVAHGRSIDWNLLEPFLRVPHDDDYQADDGQRHGTHVAGIIAGNWPDAKSATALGKGLVGMCPDLEIYDIRALGENGDEFTVMGALQFVRHLNANKDLMVIHGVNLSMAVPHDVANFACGRTPVCQECERVVASGVVVVAAAGNRGFNKFSSATDGATGDYRYISITDPGNAESVITVGATHRYMPHTYGVSYFSSRGPTGDGRTKPDLVAPGERIDSTIPGEQYDTMDGTSMAAPHVSGAAALLMARHRELVGQPERIKKILCSTATDLGREPRFQGHGMLDVLRALQSV
jgi:subtilisin family serine protease